MKKIVLCLFCLNAVALMTSAQNVSCRSCDMRIGDVMIVEEIKTDELCFAFSIKAHSFDFDVLSDSIESRQVAYALEKGDSILMYDIKNYNFNKLRKCSGLLKKLRRRNACCCTETKNDTIILLDMTNCEGMTYYSQAWNTKRPGELEMCRLVKDNVVFIDPESLVLEMYDKETSRYRYLCNTWALDQFQSEWTQRSNTRAGCWHYLVTRIIFADKKVHCIDFEYIK